MRLSIDLPDEMHRDLKAKAAGEGKTISEVVRSAVLRYLKGDRPGWEQPEGTTLISPEKPSGKVEITSVSVDKEGKPKGYGYVRSISKSDQAKGRSRK